MPIPSNALGYKNLPKQSLNYDKYSNNLGFLKNVMPSLKPSVCYSMPITYAVTVHCKSDCVLDIFTHRAIVLSQPIATE